MHRRLALAMALCSIVLLGAASGAPAQTAPQYVWKAGTVTSGGNPLNDAMEQFAKQVGERSRGRIKVDVHIANALAKGEGAHLEGVQLGTIDVVAIGSAPVGGMFEPLYQALDLPFLWSTREQVWKVMDGPLGQELLKKMESKNLKAFCFGGGWGFRNMMSNKRPIVTPDDMKGQTIRVQESPTYVAMMKAMGANPVPMAYVEVYLAMKQGTIDGMELPSFTLTSDKFQEVTKYYSLTRHSYPPIAWFMNLKKYQGLPADIQKVVDESMRDACLLHRRLEVEKEKNDFEIMKKAGVQINEVKDIKAFQALMKPAYDYVEGQVGKDFMARLRAAAQAASK
ncbi:MAG TPA: TRAP transporter substrate-binding protein [Methylomirabilota bacterium]|nr:TRAP transporter substrate-binding protein [Methylomirabilota bacterium]